MSQVFKQDLTDNSVRPGGLFFVELLMPEQCDMPARDTMVEVITKHLGLYVKLQYRHQKLATALETYAFNRALENGWIPYGQIIVGNEASMKLQESMGLHFSKSSVYWMTKNNA